MARYIEQVDDYKRQRMQQFKCSHTLSGQFELEEKYVFTSITLNMNDLAFNQDQKLFNHLESFSRIIHNQHSITSKPLSAFLNIEHSIYCGDFDHPPEITYFVKGKTQPLKGMSFQSLARIWNQMRMLEKSQFFVLNKNLNNFTSNNQLLFNLGNLIILKLDLENPRKDRKQWHDEEVIDSAYSQTCQQLIKSSQQIIKSKEFYNFIRQKLDANLPKKEFSLDFFYYLHRLEFVNLFKTYLNWNIDNNKNQKQQLFLQHLTSINNLMSNTQRIEDFDEKMKSILYKRMQEVDSSVNSDKIKRYYTFPLIDEFKDLNDQEKNLLTYTCDKLIDQNAIDIDLLESKFQYIFMNSRDFFFLQSEIKATYQQEISQQQALLDLQDQIDSETKQQLENILRSSEQNLSQIFNQAKQQGCKFDLKIPDLHASQYNFSLLYNNYLSYKQQKRIDIERDGNVCQTHHSPVLYLCGCQMYEGTMKKLCHTCLQTKHKNHNARCSRHNESLAYKIQSTNQKEQYEEYFCCEACKQEALLEQEEITFTRICVKHRLPVHTLCLQVQCELGGLCFECLKHHDESHRQGFARLDSNPRNKIRVQGILPKQFDSGQIFSAHKFFKFFENYCIKVKPAYFFLNELRNKTNKVQDFFEEYVNYVGNMAQKQNANSKQDHLLLLKIKNKLKQYNQKETMEIHEYFSERIRQLTSKLLDNFTSEIQQFEKKLNSLMSDKDLLGHAQDYLDSRYEVVTKIVNNRMDEVIHPCQLSLDSIPEHHYPRIKQVVIDEVIKKQTYSRQYVDDASSYEDLSKKYFQKQTMEAWKSFYNDHSKSHQYRKLCEDKNNLIRNGTYTLTKMLNERKQHLQSILTQDISEIRRQQIQNDLTSLNQQCLNDGQYLLKQMHDIELKVQKEVINKYINEQSPLLHQFQMIKKLPNLQHYTFKVDYPDNEYKTINSKQLIKLFNTSNLNFVDFKYEFLSSDIFELFSHLADENFNKRLSFFASPQLTNCINLNLQDPGLQTKEIKRIANHVNFGNCNIYISSYQTDDYLPSLPGIMDICHQIGSYDLTIEFNQQDVMQNNDDYKLSKGQQRILKNIFMYVELKRSPLNSLTLNGVAFSSLLNGLFGSLLQASYLLKQLTLIRCQSLDQNCLEKLNEQLEAFRLNFVDFKAVQFKGRFFNNLTKLKTLELERIYFSPNIMSLKDLKIEATLTNLTLRLLQNTYLRQWLIILKRCSLHYLELNENLLKLQDLLALQSLELRYLHICQCHIITDDFLRALNKKWPNLWDISFIKCQMFVENPFQTWLSFRNAFEITLDDNQITETQIRRIRKKGKNIKIV